MKVDVPLPTEEETPETVPAQAGECLELDGDVCIEGDGGTVDNSGQTHVPPPPPPQD
jgi:hypothetical protein